MRHQQWLEACRQQQILQDRMDAEQKEREALAQTQRDLRKQNDLKAKAEKERLQRIREYTEIKQRKIQIKAAVEAFRRSRLPNDLPNTFEPNDLTLKENIPPGDVNIPPGDVNVLPNLPNESPSAPPRKRVYRKTKDFTASTALNNLSPATTNQAIVANLGQSSTDSATNTPIIPAKKPRGRRSKNNPKIDFS